jgi:hypothetical protein
MKIYDICTKQEYMKGEEKKAHWFKVGTLKVNDDGKQFIQLNMMPSQSFYVFEQKKREDATSTNAAPASAAPKTAEEIVWDN